MKGIRKKSLHSFQNKLMALHSAYIILRKIKDLIDMLFNKSKVIYYRDRKYCTEVLEIKGKKNSIDLFPNI